MLGEILLAHLVGDYIIQSNWMATEKTKRWLPAVVHGVTYTLPYLVVTQSIPALLVICITHIIIDRFRLARYFIWAKNQVWPKSARYTFHPKTNQTGFPDGTPEYLSVWLMIITDNIIHIFINIAAVTWL